MKISRVVGREIFDSRGYPTIECELTLEGSRLEDNIMLDGESLDGDSPKNSGNPITVKASVPSGKSTGKYEAVELRDEKKRLDGKGVIKAIRNLENIIAPALVGKEPDIIQLDIAMLELDGTENKSNLGANAILAASLAILKAQAIDRQLEIYELVAHLCKLSAVSVPIPFFNFINGGMHTGNNTCNKTGKNSTKIDMQEFLIVPTEQHTFRSCMELALELFYNLKSVLIEKNLDTYIGDEGGFAPKLGHEKEVLDILMLAIEKTTSLRGEFTIAIDVAASTLYDSKTKNILFLEKNTQTRN
jgi:Enolase